MRRKSQLLAIGQCENPMVQRLSLPNCYSDAGDTNSKKPPIPAIPIPTAIQIPITTGEADRVLAQPA
ncbi:hypothetical protein, partial [Thermogutta sp.]|uniref:hypothetical protein n=1 Tax=Thermogutta sp. TaxID=1962930 RepID=UPI003C7CA15E